MAWPFDYRAELREVFDESKLDGISLDRFIEIATGYIDLRKMGLKPNEKPFHDQLVSMSVRAFGWASSRHRIEQLRDPDVRKFRPKVYLDVDLGGCALAESMRQDFVAHDCLARLPLAGCDKVACACRYVSLGRRELERLDNRGLLSSEGRLVRPLDFSDVTLSRSGGRDG